MKKNPFMALFKKNAVRLGLTLGGGGARGLAHIAFLKVMDELGIRPTVISGTSIGAVMGALYASGRSGLEIEHIFKELNLLEIVSLVDIDWLHTREGLIRGDKIIRTLAKLTRNKAFEELDIPLKVVATDFWKQEEVIFDRGNLSEAVRASISLPGIFGPVVADRQVLIDGGIVNSLPYEIIRPDCDVLVAVAVTGEIAPPEPQASPKPNIFEALMISFQTMEEANVEAKLRRSRPDYFIKPKLQGIDILDFKNMDRILASAAPDAAAFKAFLQKKMLKR